VRKLCAVLTVAAGILAGCAGTARQADADGKSVQALIALGNQAFAHGFLPEAQGYYERAIALEPDQASANNNLAVVCLARGESLEKAEKLARTALEKAGPLRAYVLDTLANVYMRQGRYGDARTALDEAEKLGGVATNPSLRDHLKRSRLNLEAYTTVQ
jgi:tetratricopeptide (TPR) repeat protein